MGVGRINQNSGYGQGQIGAMPYTTGKIFLVVPTTASNYNDIQQLYGYYPGGKAALYTTPTLALAQCVAGQNDVILLHSAYTTALTATELLNAETKGVSIIPISKSQNGIYSVNKATATLPESTQGALFTVTGRIKLISIIGEVTTVIETQANNTKLIANPTVGADVDLCAALDITAGAVGTNYNITGTLANALVATVSGAGVYQASPLIIMAGTIDLDCAATNTGSIKWTVNYEPIDEGARVIAA